MAKIYTSVYCNLHVQSCVLLWIGMNAAVRAIVRMGIYVGCRVYLIKEVGMNFVWLWVSGVMPCLFILLCEDVGVGRVVPVLETGTTHGIFVCSSTHTWQ